ncbi:MAG: Holliday junction resolvase RuvX [Frankiaceae bacterium]|nr:Holliday junction resolvase RuvX [Frankiaceae bacterium]
MSAAVVGIRPGVRVAVDVGTVRIGVAASDPTGALASPVTVVRRDPRAGSDLDQLAALVAEREAVEVVVGLPRTLRGTDSASTADARAYAAALAARIAPVPVRLVDERLTTVSAARGMRSAGRSARASRDSIDAAAAVVLLDAALDRERATGEPAGDPVPAG